MSTPISQKAIDELIETLAGIEHERWSHWQRYMHEQCERRPDGSLTIPPMLVSQWERQSATAYPDLNEKEKKSDRDQVMHYLPVVLNALDVVPETKLGGESQ
ncbi:hypothetical protein [Bradyrhizobium sp. 191]|uniref:hypothetical protein n=1 Tax=Bradyrhizobium sp. 191 TaxID=2782659 RepID=UPI001FFE31F6|nr:hypothetical protein [Bradyrhizobium sp. 191]UPJ68590.1 hypothetical protein IVB23_15825 [Bradyrhizobium sp. 191]